MMTPLPHQLAGAKWLAGKQRAFLWDSPRVGKTGAAILAADAIMAKSILVVTTASGRGVWRKAFPTWSALDRRISVLGTDPANVETDVAIVGWGSLENIPGAIAKRPDLIILDEDHKAVTPGAARTRRVYGEIVRPGDVCWHLSGTPAPHDLGNMWMRMRASCPERLAADAARGWGDVTDFDDFKARYCVKRMKRLPSNEWIEVVFGGQNEAELRARLEGMYLRRTQEDIGIRPPSYELLPLIVSERRRRECDGDLDRGSVIAAIEDGNTRELDMHLGTLRRVTGAIKAHEVVDAVKEEFDCGLEKLVLAFWHKEVGDILATGLSRFGVVRLDGATSPKERETAEVRFRQKANRVFLGQIVAAGEAIDLSPANELWFVETSLTPKDMGQMALRITNIGQKRNCFVRVCCIEGSIDEALQATLMRLWASIRKVVN